MLDFFSYRGYFIAFLLYLYKDLLIYYDYEGIEKWCSGEWKANKEGTIYYRQFCIEAMKKINISFKKVKAHSGNKYNDMADKLAKQAVFI